LNQKSSQKQAQHQGDGHAAHTCSRGRRVLDERRFSAARCPADDIKTLLGQSKSADFYNLGAKNPNLLGQPAKACSRSNAISSTSPITKKRAWNWRVGYFVLGGNAQAREEFERVLQLNPPTAVCANIERFRPETVEHQ
jgi:hypothetical protein